MTKPIAVIESNAQWDPIRLSAQLTVLAGLAWSNVLPATESAPRTIGLMTVPSKVYPVPSNLRENLSGWTYFLLVTSNSDAAVEPLALELDYLANDVVLRTERLAPAALNMIDRPGLPMTRLTGEAPATPIFLPHAFRLQTQLPAAFGIDAVHVRFRYRDTDAQSAEVTLDIPLLAFEQKVKLQFPFVGPGIISQGGALESGHRNRSGQFAIDAIGLDSHYAAIKKDDGQASSYAGWGRTILAPGPGKVIFARNDRPDQPKEGVSNPELFAPEYPDGGDPGNNIVIDHGHGEYSLIAHMKQGSVTVKIGDVVATGDPIGQLGNSGDTTGPHVHYQLQDGPKWEFANALPARFENVPSTVKGSYFDAKVTLQKGQ